MAGFIAAQRAAHQVPYATSCRALSVSPAWFYKWRDGDPSPQHARREQLNHKWYGDGTEIPTDEGKGYLDSVLDMGSRRIVGFGMSEHHDADLAATAVQMAVAVRGGTAAVARVIMHTDQGSPVSTPRSPAPRSSPSTASHPQSAASATPTIGWGGDA